MYNKYQIASVVNVLKNNKTNYWTGNECKNFEKEFSKYHNTKYSIAVSNGSVALELALKALNLKEGSEVIVTPRSFVISASSVLNQGLKPIFADVDCNGNLKLDEILKVYNKNTKAVIIVHLNGLACDLDPIVQFTKNKKIFLIEDCSQAHGAKYKGKAVGSFGDISTWSFCQDKIISTGGEGGMICTNNKKIWKSCWSYKDHGKNYDNVFHKKHKQGFRWLHDNLGSNYRMTEMQATLGRYQLQHLDRQIKKRNQIAYLYINSLGIFIGKTSLFQKLNFKCSNCPLKIPENKICKSCKHSFYRLNFFFNSKKIQQKKIIAELNKNGIQCNVGSCPEIYQEKVFKKFKAYPKQRLPNARLLGETSLMFPITPQRSLSNIKADIIIIKKILKKYFKNV
jgi:dTDP-4-amino-4,6-dideoxygalactose transaminase